MSVDLLPGCSLSGDPVQKSAISETTAQRLYSSMQLLLYQQSKYSVQITDHILHESNVLQTLSGDFALDDTQKQVQYMIIVHTSMGLHFIWL